MGSTYPTYLNKLKLLQNKAIHIATPSYSSTCFKPPFIKTNVLPLPKPFELETVKIIYSCELDLLFTISVNSFLFAKFCHFRTRRFSLKNHLSIPPFKTKRNQR